MNEDMLITIRRVFLYLDLDRVFRFHISLGFLFVNVSVIYGVQIVPPTFYPRSWVVICLNKATLLLLSAKSTTKKLYDIISGLPGNLAEALLYWHMPYMFAYSST